MNLILCKIAHKHSKLLKKSFQQIFIQKLLMSTQFSVASQKRQIVDDSNIKNFITNGKTIQVLKSKNIKSLLPVQQKTFKIIFDGQDLITSDRTGSGKTLAYLLPIIQKRRTLNTKNQHLSFLIMAPTRELVIQVVKQLQSLKNQHNQYNVVGVYGGAMINKQIYQIRNGVNYVVATPGRLLDLINRQCIDLSFLETLCLDEADEMLSRGFQQQIQQIIKHIKQKRKPNLPKIQYILFSATIPQWVLKISSNYMNKDKKIINLIQQSSSLVKTSTTVQHLAIQDQSKSTLGKIKIIKWLINEFGKNGRVIIFCKTKLDARDLSSQLEGCVPIYGDLTQRQRQISLSRFSSDNNDVKILVATDVAARGLDIQNVELVIQLQPPTSHQPYIHRSGRTGRIGKRGVSVTIFTKYNFEDLLDIQQNVNIQFKQIPNSNINQVKYIPNIKNQILNNDFSKTYQKVLKRLIDDTNLTKQQVLQKVFASYLINYEKNNHASFEKQLQNLKYCKYILSTKKNLTQVQLNNLIKANLTSPNSSEILNKITFNKLQNNYYIDLQVNKKQEFIFAVKKTQEIQIRQANNKDYCFQKLSEKHSFTPRRVSQFSRFNKYGSHSRHNNQTAYRRQDRTLSRQGVNQGYIFMEKKNRQLKQEQDGMFQNIKYRREKLKNQYTKYSDIIQQ